MFSDIVIKVENLSKCYQIYNQPRDRLLQMFARNSKQYFREFWALNDVSFEVKKGETIGIIGRNGSGKSTLLQIICGTLAPTGGSVETNGRIAALLELGSGFNSEFTGRENVYMNGAVLGLSRQEIEARFDDIAAFADIGQFIEQPVKTYSSGMVVRLAFAVQSQIDPDIFIVDEALAVGDEKFQRKCFARIEEMKDRGASILFVSHSAAQINELCDRALFLDFGERLLLARPLDVIRAYQKLIYAPEGDQQQLIEKFKLLDLETSVKVTGLGFDGATTKGDFSGQDKLVIEDKESYFDPELIPETTQSYSVQGAEIEEIVILDASGKIVNVLMLGGEYSFLLKGRFVENCHSVYFGIHIRSVSGMEVTGQRYPAQGNFIKRVTAGEKFSVKFSLKISLLNESYFVGGGVWSESDSSCLHRVLDKLMFRITIPKSPGFSFGYYDASFEDPQLSITGS